MGLNNYGAFRTAQLLNKNIAGETKIPIDINFDPNIFFAENNINMSLNDKADVIVTRYAIWKIPYAKTINISCPNTSDGKAYENPDGLDTVLQKTDKLNEVVPRNTHVKFSPDLDRGLLAECLAVCMRHKVDGTIHSNTTNDRTRLKTPSDELERIGKLGGYSGLRNLERNLGLVEFVRKHNGGMYIVGVGGIGCNPETTPAFDTYRYAAWRRYGPDIIMCALLWF